MNRATLYQSANYAAFEHRGGGISLCHLNSGWECFFQPGDDASALRETVEALDEISDEDKRDSIFDMVANEYHNRKGWR